MDYVQRHATIPAHSLRPIVRSRAHGSCCMHVDQYRDAFQNSNRCLRESRPQYSELLSVIRPDGPPIVEPHGLCARAAVHLQVSIDTNAAFFGAVTGVAALPAAFWDRLDDCPAPQDRVAAAQRVRDAEIEAQEEAVKAGFIKEATADPNLTVQGRDNGLRVPRRVGTPAPVDDEDLVEEPARERDAEAEDAGRR